VKDARVATTARTDRSRIASSAQLIALLGASCLLMAFVVLGIFVGAMSQFVLVAR
jgi:hypothetical protein